MSKMKKMLKRFSSLCLSIFLCMNSFAAIVADNDGSAFVTKSEFEALKADFAKQIQNYNESIEGKIDGAISSYLAGIKIGQAPTNLYDQYKSIVGTKPTFMNNLPGTGSATSTEEVVINLTREQAIAYWSNLYYDFYYYKSGDSAKYRAGLYFETAPRWQDNNGTWTTLWQIWSGTATGDVGTTTAAKLGNSTHSAWSTSTKRTSAKKSYTNSSQKTVNGVGAGWIYQNINGGPNLKFYDTAIYPSSTYDVWAHRYKNCAQLTASFYTGTTGKSDTTAISFEADKLTALGNKATGTKYTGTNTNNGTYSYQRLIKKETRNGVKYWDVIFPTLGGNTIYCYNEIPTLTTDSATSEAKLDNSYFYDICYGGAGGKLQTNTMSGVTFKYYPHHFTVESKYVRNFHINSLNTLVGERVYHGQGFPIIRVEANDTNCQVQIKFGSSTTGTINYKLSEKKMTSNNFDSTARYKLTGTASKDEIKTFNFEELQKDTVLWLNVWHATSGAQAYIESVSVKLK